jgi:hypothetical protein
MSVPVVHDDRALGASLHKRLRLEIRKAECLRVYNILIPAHPVPYFY